MPPALFHRILRKMHRYGLHLSFVPRFWEYLQDAFNQIMVANFTPHNPSTQMKFVFTLDDEKTNFAYGSAREIKLGCESGLKRVRHVKDNKTGLNNHVLCYAVTDIPIVSVFEHEHHANEKESFDEMYIVLQYDGH